MFSWLIAENRNMIQFILRAQTAPSSARAAQPNLPRQKRIFIGKGCEPSIGCRVLLCDEVDSKDTTYRFVLYSFVSLPVQDHCQKAVS